MELWYYRILLASSRFSFYLFFSYVYSWSSESEIIFSLWFYVFSFLGFLQRSLHIGPMRRFSLRPHPSLALCLVYNHLPFSAFLVHLCFICLTWAFNKKKIWVLTVARSNPINKIPTWLRVYVVSSSLCLLMTPVKENSRSTHIMFTTSLKVSILFRKSS